MHNTNAKQKILVIVGPTASGKTSLSIEIAKQFNGEVVSADSRQVYKGLDIGTGKVTHAETQGVPHHLINVANPEEQYTVNDFVRDGRTIVTDIKARGKLPIIAGGTFFYVDALLGRITAPQVKPNETLRAKLEEMNIESLHNALLEVDERRATDIDPHNKRRLIRALEIVEAIGVVPKQNPEPVYDALLIGIDISKAELHESIHKRLIERLQEGMVREVNDLHQKGLSYERMEELGLEYRYITRFLKNELSEDEMATELENKIRQFAKRQMTWLKRDTSIHWVKSGDLEKSKLLVSNFLNS